MRPDPTVPERRDEGPGMRKFVSDVFAHQGWWMVPAVGLFEAALVASRWKTLP